LTEDGRRRRIAEGTAAVLFGLGAVVFWIALAGVVWSPVVKQHCYTVTAGEDLDVESGWTFRLNFLPFIDDNDIGDDGRVCIRNSATREALSAIGIWKLESPAEQAGSQIGRAAEDQLGEGTEEYFESVVALRPESDRIAATFLEEVQAAQTRDEVLVAVENFRDDTEALADELRQVTPPESLAALHESLLETNDEGVQILNDLAAAVQFGSREEAAKEFAEYEAYAREATAELRSTVRELQQQVRADED
jgi:hypothetical protein